MNKTTNRKEREKLFHDQRYNDDQRKILAPVYSFAEYSKGFFENIVTNIKTNDKVLEIGCGTNSISKKIIEKGADVTIIDISEKAIEVAKQDYKSGKFNAKCLVMDAENLTFKDCSFDLVYGVGILHHLSIDKSMSEINKVLKSGGKAVFYEPLGHNVFINIFRFITPNLRTKDEHPLLIKDFKIIKQTFPETNFYYFHFFSLLSIIFVKIPILKRLIYFMNVFDKLILKMFPFLKKYFWVTIIEINKCSI